MASLATWIATAEARIVALGFVVTDGLLAADAEPLALDRRFEIVGVEVGTTQQRFGTDAVQRLGRVEVVVAYDGGPDRAAALARILDDNAAIIDDLEFSHSGAIQRVTCTGSPIEDGRQGHGFTARLAFEILYVDS
jgi:hypothetical protein